QLFTAEGQTTGFTTALSFCYSRDGSRLAAVVTAPKEGAESGASAVRIWDAVAGQQVADIPIGDSSPITRPLAISPDGSRVASLALTSAGQRTEPSVQIIDASTP